APADQVMEALVNSLGDEKAHQYQSYQGLPELRKGACSFYQQYFDVSVESNTEELPLMGSKEGIMQISMAFLNTGDAVLIQDPGYPTYTYITKLVRAHAKYYDIGRNSIWFPAIEGLEKKAPSKVKIMWLSYPHMLTGA